MKHNIKFDGNKNIVVIRTPLSSTTFTQVTCLMTDEEFEAAKKERPDLVFKLATELDQQNELNQSNQSDLQKPQVDDETKGITVRGLTLPHNLDDMINHLFEKDKV